ncbi:OmpH family outer membrane protein [Chloracidobacterium aggregatum]|uniref:OmpH family outer membrane protein n=1 Tax=Chloracidobacterium sp. N TaxID=2821540 RepID=A0ABX8B1L7_9BACT|nr:OmpH family outer membrane protein [Chloracidobacterium aggregatum]QUV84807.1 OmpH family outer membrane protein [Chloracidobacterium sp. 2]QUV88792.1 OmpH family outer membrane protein [Chloracidobacterium sp. S]QUV94884.1 OmpH family outer membrane protein [Chloracidobacterium sp. N]QUV95996.1 OmpH family outer membrane protein [Chloracidobacterium sp. E]
MKFSLPLWVLATVAAGFTTAAAQALPTGSSQPAAPAKATSIPTGRVVIVNTLVFGDKIDEFRRQAQKLEEKFKPRTTELENMAKRLQELGQKVQDEKLSVEVRRQAQEQGLALEKEYKRKDEDLRADIEREQQTVLNPLREKVFKFMESYAAARGIIMIIDVGALAANNNLGMIPYVDNAADITEDFIREYNRANPVAAPATSAKP